MYFNFQVNQNPVYQIYATIISFYGPTCIMIILYAKMWLAAKRLAKRDRMLTIGTNGSINGNNLAKSDSPASLSDPSNRSNRQQYYHYHRSPAILQKIPMVRFLMLQLILS